MRNKVALAVSTALMSISIHATADSSFDKDTISKAAFSPEISAIKDFSTNKNVKPVSLTHDYYIVQLEDAPLAKYNGGVANISATSIAATGDKKLNVASKAAKSYKAYLETQQNSFISSLGKQLPGAKVFKQFDTVYNGVVVYVNKKEMSQLHDLPGVKSVHPQRMFHTSMDRSLDIINSAEAWASMGGRENAGAGVKVAIIDTGIRPENPLFSGENFELPADLSDTVTTDYCHTTDLNFCNNKLIVARWSEPTFAIPEGEEHYSPLAFGGHGVHVAGTAVGNVIDIEYAGQDVTISGVAPGAYLMVYKALFNGSGSNIMLMEAVEHAVADGADVINNSWGGGAGMDPAFSAYNDAFKNAEAAGVVLVNAAGNDGNGAQTIGCPSCIDAGLSVANTTHGRFFANTVDANGEQYMAIDSTSPAITEDVTMPMISAMSVEAANVEGCAPFADSEAFTDSIALISRGACAFTDKATNAEAAGAKGIVIYNNQPTAPFPMAIETTLPAMMVSKVDGEMLVTAASTEGFTATLNSATSRVVIEQYTDNVAQSSSRGPNGDANVLKPDIAAPGTNILSGASPDSSNGEHFMVISGTSMASPHVAGAAALVIATHPEWNATQVQTALTSTSIQDIVNDDSVSPTNGFDIGAGRLDVPAAVNAMVTFDKPSMASAACIGTCVFERNITNMMAEEGEWTPSVTFSDANATGSVSTEMLTLGANGSETASSSFMLTVDTSFAEAATWVMGQLTWTHTSGTTAVMPIAVFANESTDTTLLTNAGVGEFVVGEGATVRTAIANKTFTEEISVAVETVGATINTESATAVVTGGTQTSLAVDETTGKLTWKGTLDTSVIEVAQGALFSATTGNFFDLHEVAEQDIPVTTHECSSTCDESSFELEYNFMYKGAAYDTLTVSTNGFIVAGSEILANAWNNQDLPNSAAPNNVLAPYWTDFDLDGTGETDTGAGNIMYSSLSLGGDNVLVIQWDQVARWNADPTETYTFQIWIFEGTDKIFFTYGDLAATPASLTIGAEDITGENGTNYYYNGAGNADFTAFDALTVRAAVGGTVDFDYKVAIDSDNTDFITADTSETMEEESVMIDVAVNDMSTANFVAKAELSSGETMHNASKLIAADLGLDASSVTIAEQPANGTATVDEQGMVTYVPNTDFFGTDTFTYTITNSVDVTSAPGMVSIDVTNVPDSPTLSAPAATSVVEKQTATLTANGYDGDGDELTYNWVQLSGTPVSFSGNETISFTAPSTSVDTLMSFQVTATAGGETTEPVIATITVVNKKESGSLAWLLLAAPLLWLRRRTA